VLIEDGCRIGLLWGQFYPYIYQIVLVTRDEFEGKTLSGHLSEYVQFRKTISSKLVLRKSSKIQNLTSITEPFRKRHDRP